MCVRHSTGDGGGCRLPVPTSHEPVSRARRQHRRRRVEGLNVWSVALVFVMVAGLAHVRPAAAGTCSARVTTPLLHTTDKRDCACWPDVELAGVPDVPQSAPLPSSGLLATQHVCSVEVFNGETAKADPDADLSTCSVQSCPYKWAYSVNFVGEVLLYRVELSATNTGVSVMVATPDPGTATLGVYARWGTVPEVTVSVTAACAVSATPVADSFQYSATGSAASPGLAIAVPDADIRHGVLFIAVVAQGDFSASENELVSKPLHVTLDVTVDGACASRGPTPHHHHVTQGPLVSLPSRCCCTTLPRFR